MDHRVDVDASPATFRFDVRQLTADDVTLTPRPKDPPAPPDRFGKLLKVGTLGVLIERLVNGALEVIEKLHGLWKRYRSPAADSRLKPDGYLSG